MPSIYQIFTDFALEYFIPSTDKPVLTRMAVECDRCDDSEDGYNVEELVMQSEHLLLLRKKHPPNINQLCY